MQHRRIARLLALASAIALLASSLPPAAWGQGAVTYASLAGDVVDKTGAALAGAKVTVKNNGTGQSRQTVTDSNGHFAVAQLTPGNYKISIEEKGFKTWILDPLTLDVGGNRVLKASMELGAVEQLVQVNAEAATVETTNTEVSDVIQPVQIRELPLNQRSFTALVVQQPGLVQVTSTAAPSVLSAATNTGSLISADGSMGFSVAYLMDGVNFSNGAMTAPGTAAAGDMPGVEAIQEFKVLSHNYSAAYGGAAGAVVSFATKTGTNKLHGSVYEYLRNNALDAREYFNNVGVQNPFRRNQFGASLGGPIVKDKTFFFVNYEGLRQSLTQTVIAFVPDANARNGIINGVNVSNPSNFAQVQPILNLYPTPPANAVNLGNGVAEAPFQNHQPTRQDFGVVNITHALTNNDQLSARYQIVDANATATPNIPNFLFLRQDRDQNLLLKWARTISPRLVNTASFSILRQNIQSSTAPAFQLQPSEYTGNSSRQTIGVITVGNGSAGTSGGALSLLGNDDASPFRLAKNTFPFNDDLIYVHGNHSLKFGGMAQRFQWNWFSATIPGGSYTFPSLTNLIQGDPSVVLIHRDGALSDFHVRTTQLAWYVEDAWRVTPRFTLTAGLRHEFQVPVLTDTNNKLGNWQSPFATSVTVGTPYNNYSLTQFQPRLGIAWDPFGTGKTVIRAGFGIFNNFIDFSTDAQGILQWNAPQPVLNTYFGHSLIPVLPVIPFPLCDNTPECTAPGPFPGLVTGVLTPVNSPTTNQWNIELQRELPAKLTVSLTYAGSHSYHLPRKLESNYNIPCGGIQNPVLDANGLPVFPLSGACAPQGTGAPGITGIGFSLYSRRYDTIANYNAGTVQLSRSSGGLTLAGSYTFAKALSQSDAFNSNNFLTGVAESSIIPWNPRYDYSESAFSVRHRFTENVVYALPFGHGQKFGGDWGSFANNLLGGWTVSSLGSLQSGQPFTVFAGFDISGIGDAIDFPDRPDLLRANPIVGSVGQWFDPTAFALPAAGHVGTAPRTPLRGPTYKDVDFSVSKQFGITERTNLLFRSDFFNIANHPNFALPFNQVFIQTGFNNLGQPTGALNPQAGRITSTVGVPREIQFSLKLLF